MEPEYVQSECRFPILQALAVKHRAECDLHTEDSPNCNVLTLKGDPCRYKGRNGVEPDGTIPGRLPVCGMHRPFAPSSGRCKAILSCGFECARLFKWSPGEVLLCPDHRDIPQPCYFMKLPAELRLKIYQQLFLEPLPHKRSYSDTRTHKGNRTSILRVNRKISEEAASVFYGYPKFTIEVGPDEIYMAGDLWEWNYFKNLLREKPRLEKSDAFPYRPIALLGAPKHPFLKCTTIKMPMGKVNFSRMRSFHIHIHLTHPQKKARANLPDYSWDRQTKNSFHMVADNLQKLEVLLKLVKPNIHNLSVSIQIDYHFSGGLAEKLAYSVNALRWISGLQFVTNVSIQTVELGNEPFSLLPQNAYKPCPIRPTLIPFKTAQITKEEMPIYNLFVSELSIWKNLVSSRGGRISKSRIMLAFLKLENLLWTFQAARVRQFREDDDTLPNLIYRARNALHEEDLEAMNVICKEAVKHWSDHVIKEKDLKLCAWGEFIAVNALTSTRKTPSLGELLEAMEEMGISTSIIPDPRK
ncbi:hypothetical protein MauCBS54593_000086 [Microsporum audouinii]